MEKAQKAKGLEQFWVCDRDTCRFKVMTHDVTGKVYKRPPRTCPSCGKLPDTPREKIAATRDPR
jgi:hypothetical protein